MHAGDPLDQLPFQRTMKGAVDRLASARQSAVPPQTPKPSTAYKQSPLAQSPMNIPASSDRSSSPVQPSPAQQKTSVQPTAQKQQQQRKLTTPINGSLAASSPSMPSTSAGPAPQKRKEVCMPSATDLPPKKARTEPQAQFNATSAAASEVHPLQHGSSTIEGNDTINADCPTQQTTVSIIDRAEMAKVPQQLVEYIMAWSAQTMLDQAKVQEQV